MGSGKGSSQARTGASGVSKHVLVVEDDRDVQELLCSVIKLADAEAELDCVERADAAESLLRQGKIYDLVIADLSLAENTDGLDIWRACRAIYPNMKFLYISGISPEEFFERAGAPPAQAPAFLAKPFTLKQCVQTVRALLGLEPS